MVSHPLAHQKARKGGHRLVPVRTGHCSDGVIGALFAPLVRRRLRHPMVPGRTICGKSLVAASGQRH